MRIKLGTKVNGDYRKVLARFDHSLFKALNPPGAKIEILRFDGSHEGDTVHIRMTLAGFIKDEWLVNIVDEGENEKEAWFTDEGVKLPFFLKKWRHRHIVENHGSQSKIVDDINFSTPFWLMDILMYPILYLQFAWRKPIYRRVFGSGVGA